jgi:hypothetical protein
MSNTAQAFSNPLIRKQDNRDSRALDGIDQSKIGQQNVGIFTRPMPGGVATVIDARRRGSGAQGHPFRCLGRKSDGSVQIEQGTVNGKSATEYFVSIPSVGFRVIYIEINPDFDDIEDYITGATFANFTIKTGSSVPSDTSTLFRRLIASYNNGVKVGQPVRNSLEVAFCGTVEEPQARWGISG